ncbi:C-GCAxxG-C-C family protein [Anaerofustis stercorihominis]|uniref:Oxidoreductase n=2 Tax=Anaerofustis stercorihominis TaxID=214853 RepID=B1CAT0_9FIRM|nr:C-GCAxxG-C-C family protein [Anaerofustis stercorihominis]EDS71377.1 oxidoreductase [Anaerofustis stercorihominis DSM 17244]MCQ4795329.1 C-GCAxxG-C-C family protein [Anaerofustis stercorihominis]RGD73431.1 C_GCAxxG_C_C family protein [Anaerofustis stercorihominis]
MEKSRVDIAVNKFKSGYNCAQAVVCTYCDLLGLDEETAFAMSEAFGTGIARMQETCGSVCGMIMLAGLLNSDKNLKEPKTKIQSLTLGKELADKFKEMNTTVRCRELKSVGMDRPPIRSCDGCVHDSAEIIEKYLLKKYFE